MNKREMLKAKIESLSSVLVLSIVKDALSFGNKELSIAECKELLLKQYQRELEELPPLPVTKQITLEQAINEEKRTCKTKKETS